MGKRRGGGRMLDAVSLLLLLLGCCCCVWPQKQILVVADTDPNDVTALNTLFNSLNSPGQLKGWQANGGDPCGHSWQGITCSGSSVTAIKLPSLGLSMNLGYNMNTMNSLVEIDMSQNNLGGGQAIQYKRLNDCLSMLRSVLPKISKMDRTSILGDTIDYMKELLERIRQLQEEIDQQQETPAVLNVFRELNPNDMLARNTPKFEVERKEGGDTWVEIYFAARLGLLLSTVSTLEMLGLDIQ